MRQNIKACTRVARWNFQFTLGKGLAFDFLVARANSRTLGVRKRSPLGELKINGKKSGSQT
ncbi:MAG TPA: hypothetical protein DCE44_02940 [Verrucomicrobiales bacterium]|nr:hypothetical protein [Verrucomicrobiales bacterium]